MKIKILLLSLLTFCSTAIFAQNGGIKGQVVSRDGRVALSHVEVVVAPAGITVQTDEKGNFLLNNLPSGDYELRFTTPEFEELVLNVRVDKMLKDVRSVIMIPDAQYILDDSIFGELDSDTSTDDNASPSSLSASKDLFASIASYRFSEMRFNVRGYDSQNQEIYLNGIRFNDANTGFGPWSLWTGLNDATRNQENVSGLTATDFGIGGIAGMTNVNARASLMRKGWRMSLVNANSMYRFRAMVSYASGQLDNGWSYAFSFSTRQGGNSYVDGVYYNTYAYFASVEKLMGRKRNHRLGFTILGSPSERGAQMAATEEAFHLFGDHYYNSNVGYQNGTLRNTRVRDTHEPIAMLTYNWDISERTRLSVATSLRFGKNGYSALTWKDGSDPRPDYYRNLPSYFYFKAAQGITPEGDHTWFEQAEMARKNWTGRVMWDEFYRQNYQNLPDAGEEEKAALNHGYAHPSNTIIEERHTDQLDYNFVANISHQMRNGGKINGGVKVRINRTEYYDEVKDLLGGDYWYDIDKFALRDMGSSPLAYQNDLDYYLRNGHAKLAKKGDKISYDYYANLREAAAWAMLTKKWGIFTMGIGGQAGHTSLWRDGRWRKGLFPNDSYGESKTLNYFTYRAKANFGFRFSRQHSIEANVTAIQNAPNFRSAFVSARTRNQVTPGLKEEKIYGAELVYNLELPWMKARVAGYYTEMKDQSKVISFYNDIENTFVNFAMSGIDKRHYGVEAAIQIPLTKVLTLNGAVSWGNYQYTSNPDFISIADNRAEVMLKDKVYWKDFHVESTPQLAANIGLNLRTRNNWFASVDCNIYNDLYLSMNPFYRTGSAVKEYIQNDDPVNDIKAIREIRHQQRFGVDATLGASLGKNWYIQRKYTLGFSLEVKNICNDQDIRTGGYEQMRMQRGRFKAQNGTVQERYFRFPSKYYYMLGTTYYLNVYFRF